MEGYTIPHPDDPNRYDTWFVRGRCFPEPTGTHDDDVDVKAFARLFGTDESQFSYALPKLFSAYQTVVYLDEDMRVTIGNHGSVMINGRESVYFQQE